MMTLFDLFLSVYLLSWCHIAQGFIEVGTYSRLEATQSFNQSTDISGWKDSGRKGLGSHNAVKEGATFDSKFTAPSQGVYYVSTILLIERSDDTTLKAFIIVNDDLKYKTGLTGFQSSNNSVTVSGLVQLYIGDMVSVHVQCQNGSFWTVLSGSTFFVQLVQSMTIHPAFQASLSRDIMISSSIWRRLEDWNTESSMNFQIISGFSQSLGTFCPSFNGIYQVDANILLDLSQSNNGSVALFFRNQTILSESYFGNGKYVTASIRSIFKLQKGECLELRTRSLQGTHKIYKGSGFLALFLATDAKLLRAASYKLSAPAPVITSAGLHPISIWNTLNPSVFFESGSAILLNGTSYQVQTDGQYFINAQVNTRALSWSPAESIQLLVIVDYKSSSVQSEASIFSKEVVSSVNSLALSGVLELKKGQLVTLCVQKDRDKQVFLMTNSLFSVSMVPKDWPGVSAVINTNQVIPNPGWNEVGNWTVRNQAEGSFSFDGAFSDVSGRYVTPLEGTYIVSCNIILSGSAGSPLELMIAVDGNLDGATGLYLYRKTVKDHLTLSTSGLVRLMPGQHLSVFVRIETAASWTIAAESSFSVVLNGAGKADEHGFIGVKTQGDSYTTANSWEEVKGWQARDNIHQSQNRWDVGQRRYTPLEDGIYYVSVNLIISHPTADTFHILIAGNGETDKYSAGQNFHSAQNSNSKFSLTASCSVKLSSSHYVSVFVKSTNGGSWSVLGNSSISIALISLMTNSKRVGVNTITSREINYFDNRYSQTQRWNEDDNYGNTYKYNVEFILKFVPERIYFKISESGLYFAEIALRENQELGTTYSTFKAALCIYIERSFKYIAFVSSKKAEGPTATSIFGISAFGVVYLTKGSEVAPCVSGYANGYYLKGDSGFSLVRIVPRDMNPGLRQIGAASINDQLSRDWTAVSDWRARGESSLYRYNIINSYGQDSINTLSGTYLLTSSLSINKHTSDPVYMCIGKQNCSECYLESSVHKGGLTMSGVVRLPAQERISTCVRQGSLPVTRSAQFLPQASPSSSLFFRHSLLEFTSSGLKSLNSWISDANSSDDSLSHNNINVSQSGLYLVTINIVLGSSFDSVLQVSVNLEADGRSRLVPGLYGESWVQASNLVPFGLISLVRITSKSSLDVTVYSDRSSSWKIEGNATFSVALLTKDSTHTGFTVKRAFNALVSLTPNWSYMGDWIEVDIGLASPLSLVRQGRYIVDEYGIYLVVSKLLVSVQVPAGKECIIEMVVSIDDMVNDSSLKTLQVIQGQASSGRRTVTLSIASSVRLYKWQAVFPMVRSSIPVANVEILATSMFYVALIEKHRYYSNVNGSLVPHIIVHPVPYIRVAADACQSIELLCQAQSDSVVRYKWIKDGQLYKETQNIIVSNARVSDAGRYVCIVESSSITLSSSFSIVEVFATSPAFSNSSFEVFVKENLPNQNLLVLDFAAITTKNEQANVSLTIFAGNINDTFLITPSVSSNSTTLINTIPLDFEQIQTYQLTIMATNTATRQLTAILVTIRVIDINDNHPLFSPPDYSTSVPEDAWIGASITQVTAVDKDRGSNGQIRYSIDHGNEGGVFAMSSQGFVLVDKSLDYENRKWYNLTISARDLGNPPLLATNYAYVIINITDTNDIGPTFSSLTYSLSTAENSPVNTAVGRVEATDSEEGDNGRILYSIQDVQIRNTFSTNQTNGQITLLQSLDYEVNKTVDFVVIATDQGSPPRFGVALVRVSILDVNDNPPEFLSDGYSVNITEATLVGTKIIGVRTKDKDSEVNSHVGYNIISGNIEGAFSINDMGIIVLDKTLDRENTSQYNLTLEAYDKGSPFLMPRAVSSVLINVEDANEHFPQFSASVYSASVPENTSGYDVLKVYATDQDTASNAQISYQMDYSCSTPLANQTFIINKTSGMIVLNKRIDYDTTSDKSLRLRVLARDGGTPPLLSYADVVVMVTDVNDNPPVFDRVPPSALNIPDNYPINKTVFIFDARDQDSGTNAQVVYSIEEVKKNGELVRSNFDIDSNTGRFFVSKEFDKNTQDQYGVVIKARDSGTPSLSTTTSVNITVDDVNDNSPQFKKSSYSTSFPRSVEKGRLLVTVEATDEDVGNNSVIDYILKLMKNVETCEKISFTIASNGSIYNEQELEAGCNYTLIVTAKDRGEPPLNTTCTVYISVMSRTTRNYPHKGASISPTVSSIIGVMTAVAVVLIIIVVFIVIKMCWRQRQTPTTFGTKTENNKERPVQFIKMTTKNEPSEKY